MTNLDRIRKLIEEIPQIEKCFQKFEAPVASSYDYHIYQRRTITVTYNVIYKSPEFIRWREKLESELSKLKQTTDIEEIRDLCNEFNGYRDEKYFNELKTKLEILKDNLENYEPDYDSLIRDERIQEDELSETMLRILGKLQRNHYYNRDCDENTINDYIRDLLGETKTVKDQSRQGDSESGNDAGEVDIQILDSELPIVMIEGLKLHAVVKNTLNMHIRKTLVHYDPNGCPYAFLLIYFTGGDFVSFCNRLLDYLKDYDFPFDRQTDILEKETPYAELKHAQTVLLRKEKYIRVHFYAVNIREAISH